MGLELGLCTRKSKVLPWSHARRTRSLPSTVHKFRPQISVYNHFRRHFTPTILIHCFMNELKTWKLCQAFASSFSLQLKGALRLKFWWIVKELKRRFEEGNFLGQAPNRPS